MNGARRDGNERAIIDALVSCGCSVQQIFQGKGVPDLLVWSPLTKRFTLLEVKDPRKPKASQALTDDQVKWHEAWSSAVDAGAVVVVRTAAQAIAACDVVKR